MLHWSMTPSFRDMWRATSRAERWLFVGAVAAYGLMLVSIFNGSFAGAILASTVNAVCIITLIRSLKGW